MNWMNGFLPLLAAMALAALAGCGDVTQPPPPEPPPPASLASTVGGGVMTSASYRMDLWIGAPQPLGRASSASYHTDLGPGSNHQENNR